jgi:hypothetical protein
VLVELDAGPTRVGEASAPYGARAGAMGTFTDSLVGAWPYSPDALERQRARLQQRRQAALVDLDRAAQSTVADPEGLTSVDYLREWRDPDHDASTNTR